MFAAGAGATRSKPVACGDTITASLKLDHDLTDCPSNGIVIGADGITLDLNGHTIDGDGTEVGGCGAGEACDLGVDSSRGGRGPRSLSNCSAVSFRAIRDGRHRA